MFIGKALAGYMIAQPNTLPGGSWGYLDFTFGATPTEAWMRMLGPEKSRSIDREIIIQRLMDRGYRLVKARLEVMD